MGICECSQDKLDNQLNVNINEDDKNKNGNYLSIIKEEVNQNETSKIEGENDENKSKLKSHKQKYDIQNYPNDVLFLINKIRSNPKNFIPEIENALKLIAKEKDKFIYNGTIKVFLNKGEEAFRNAIDVLTNTQPMENLEYYNDICIDPPNNEDELKDPKFFQNKIIEKKKDFYIHSYFKDAIKDPFISVLINIIDDTSTKTAGKKRECILNREYKYIGITCKKIGKKFVAYFTFSK